jgi:hypothetical protein
MQIIPLQAVESQQVLVVLDGQSCQINVYQKNYGLFLDLYVNNSLIIGGVLCENINPIVRNAYLGFAGELLFIDRQGTDDPIWTGLGTRFVLAYADAADAAAATA